MADSNPTNENVDPARERAKLKEQLREALEQPTDGAKTGGGGGGGGGRRSGGGDDDGAAAPLGIYTSGMTWPNEPRVAKLRRRGPNAAPDTVGMATLVETDGALFWQNGVGSNVLFAGGTGASASRGGGGRRGGAGRRGPIPPAAIPVDVVDRTRFELLQPNQIGSFLAHLDTRLTPKHDVLRRWDGTDFVPLAGGVPKGKKRVLLWIHGTFSNNDHFISELQSHKPGEAFLKWAEMEYDLILAFDHQTLSVSPLLNALDLSRLFADVGAETKVDVICHSRGGLVARWWMEVFQGDARVERAVLVGSPLAGTSLAAPPRLRAMADLLTNLARVVQHGNAAAAAVTAMPLFAIAAGFMRIVASVTSVVAKMPLFDAAVLLVPGLAAQSRVGNNHELLRLRRAVKYPDYYAICSNFDPPDVPVWKFWRYFKDPVLRAANYGADLLFDGENDLVVDTKCMIDLADKFPINKRHTFGREDQVHHLNYFRQKTTVDLMQKHLAR